MALITCQECGTEVSTAAKSCPHCGASGNALRGRRKLGLPAKLLLGLVGVTAIATAASEMAHTKEHATAASQAEDKVSKERDLNIVSYARSLKAAMRNPDSLVYERVRSNPDGTLICFRVRAQNGFGGMNRQTVAFTPAGGSQDAFAVRTICRDKSLQDVSYSALPLIKRLG